MDILSYETILGNLPVALAIWTAVTLSWGTYIATAFGRMMKYADKFKGGRRCHDVTNHRMMVVFNLFLAAYLLFESVADTMFGDDAIIVLNVFYAAYLIPSTITVVRWFLSKPSPAIPPDHLLT